MVGPVVKIDPSALAAAAQHSLVKPATVRALPHLVDGWDVCLLPFALNQSTRFISPTKTLEYMAAEKPIVSTPIRDVVQLYGDSVAIAAKSPTFVRPATRRSRNPLQPVARASPACGPTLRASAGTGQRMR
jgi:UDP-galactopyranose mutase